jgi:hypothetical protein
MMNLTYLLPAELQKKLDNTRADHEQPPADGFMHEGRLNMGPAILVAVILSVICWAIIIAVVLRVFH